MGLLDELKEAKTETEHGIIPFPHEDMILYHGSKGGLEGAIAPSSRVRCDFGQGFYMGTDLMQAKSLVSGDDMPYYYKLRFRMSEIPRDRILVLNDKAWLSTVLACRRADPEFSALDIAKNALDRLKQHDVVIGRIADDKMREAISSFTDNALTDARLYRCLTCADYGYQIVARTGAACSKIEILEEKRLKGQELQAAVSYSELKRRESRNIVDQAKREYDGHGHTFYSWIRHEKEQEKRR